MRPAENCFCVRWTVDGLNEDHTAGLAELFPGALVSLPLQSKEERIEGLPLVWEWRIQWRLFGALLCLFSLALPAIGLRIERHGQPKPTNQPLGLTLQVARREESGQKAYRNLDPDRKLKRGDTYNRPMPAVRALITEFVWGIVGVGVAVIVYRRRTK